jgi:hypothetical protein
MYRCFIIWDSRWHIIAFPALIYLASAGTPHVIRVIHFVEQLIAVTLGLFHSLFCSGLRLDGGGVRHTRHIYAERKAYRACCTMGHAERELEYYRHLDDLLSSPADASSNAAGALSRDVQYVYEHRHDAHRVCRAFFHRWYRSRRHSRTTGTARICIWLCLEYILR